ncbi:serine/threonine-protein phosphatase 7 long form homolog [Diospyros lotus]|uniref:serine/threonine-protein phosphatase 7 long form homolog n=1 Tax=Diospyros lotus TaxID=55363 RepID=UPI002255F2DA|nr:serine/threonine-protein phosphatase 7 long form homolog [Diospyros lotus]
MSGEEERSSLPERSSGGVEESGNRVAAFNPDSSCVPSSPRVMDAIGSMHGPGPIDKQVLHLQDQHRSVEIWDGYDPGPLTCRHRQSTALRRWAPHPRMFPYMSRAGFYHVYRLGFGFKIDWPLMTALVERWRQETHTFHLSIGETTVTLQDVAVLMGLRIDGPPVTGASISNWAPLCEQYLGARPSKEHLRGSSLKLTWLRKHFMVLPDDATDEVVERYTRAYILFLIGGQLCPDKSASSVQLLYLPLLVDFDYCGTLSWGGAVLATLYRALCRACQRGVHEICGPLLLLQLWSWERLHVGRPTRLHLPEVELDNDGAPVDPLGRRWRVRFSNQKNPVPHILQIYREKLDQQTEDQVIWQPYTPNVLAELPAICLDGQHIWRAEVPLICFDIIEWYFPRRVMRQFGLVQLIPPGVDTELALHKQDRRGKRTLDWVARHARYVELWQRRHESVVVGQPWDTHLHHHGDYMTWFRRITRRIISRGMQFQSSGDIRNTLQHVVWICERGSFALGSWGTEGGREALANLVSTANQWQQMLRDLLPPNDPSEQPLQHRLVEEAGPSRPKRKTRAPCNLQRPNIVSPQPLQHQAGKEAGPSRSKKKKKPSDNLEPSNDVIQQPPVAEAASNPPGRRKKPESNVQQPHGVSQQPLKSPPPKEEVAGPSRQNRKKKPRNN